MVDCFFLAAVFRISVHMNRKSRDRFRKDTDAGVYRRHLHGGTLGNRFARRGSAEEEGVRTAGGFVLRLAPESESRGL